MAIAFSEPLKRKVLELRAADNDMSADDIAKHVNGLKSFKDEPELTRQSVHGIVYRYGNGNGKKKRKNKAKSKVAQQLAAVSGMEDPDTPRWPAPFLCTLADATGKVNIAVYLTPEEAVELTTRHIKEEK